MGQGIVDPYPWFLHKQVEFDVDGRPMHMQIHVNEWTERWRPLLEYMHHKHVEHPRRLMVAIGGPPGSGKSYIAEQISWIIGKGLLPGCFCTTLPMEGFFYPHQYLRQNYRKTSEGNISLADVKGGPDTYDVASMKISLERLKTAQDEDIFWPGFNKDYNDVIPRLYRVSSSFNVILVQGDFLLLDRGPYSGLPGLFDARIYIESPAAAVISHLMQRHILNGSTEFAAKERLKKIDLPNARIAESTRTGADLIIERNTLEELVSLKWKNPADEPQLDMPIIPHEHKEGGDDPGVF